MATKQRKGAPGPSSAAPHAPAPSLSFSDASQQAVRASRFGVLRTELATPFTWVNPQASAVACAVVLSLFVAHVLKGFSLVSIGCNVAVLMLVVAAAIHVHNSLQPQASVPQLSLPLDRASVTQLGVIASDQLNLAIEGLNRLLSWEHPLVSCRALGYAWLAARFAWTLAPGYVFTGLLLCFVAVPMYLRVQRLVDSLLDDRVLPVARKVAGALSGVEQHASSAIASNGTTVGVGAAAVALASLYTFWGVLSLPGMCTLLAVCVAARDALASTIDPASGPKRD